MKVFLTGQAHRDIAGIKAYLSEKNRPNAANTVAKRLYRETSDLAKSPQKGIALSAKFGIQSDLRMWIVPPNLILYRIAGDKIIVIRIIDERRDYLAELGLREYEDDGDNGEDI